MAGGPVGGLYFGEYGLVLAPAPPPAAAAPVPGTIGVDLSPGLRRAPEFRRGWRFHRRRYDVLQGARVLGSVFTFAAALELAVDRGGDSITSRDPRRPLRELRRWSASELEPLLEKVRRQRAGRGSAHEPKIP